MDSDDESDTQIPIGTPASIILINAYDPKSLNSAQVAHAATCQLMLHYLRSVSSQLIGVTVYGTENTTSSTFLNVTSVIDIFPLSSLSTKNYKDLKNTDVSKIPQAKELLLSEVFAHCSKEFSNCKRKLSSRTIFMLSSFDIPPQKQDELATLEAVRTLVDLNTEINFINISQSQYEPDPFYCKLIKEAHKMTGENIHVKIPDPVWSDKTILQQMLVDHDQHFSTARLKFDIGNEIHIGVRVYKLLKGLTKPKSQKINKNTYEPVSSVKKSMKMNMEEIDTEDNQNPKLVPILKSELLRYQQYGGESIEFTDNEYNFIRNPFGKPKIKLLGFKPANSLCKEKWFTKSCYFLFPDEQKVEGSTVAFKALHQACCKTGVVAICLLSTTANAKLLIVALSPSTKPLGQDVPIGFDIIPLPFVENVRDLPVIEEDEDIKITEQQKSIMQSVIDSLKFDYQPDMFEDPVLEKLLNVIEGKALENDQETFIDTTQHDDSYFECIDNEKFIEAFGPLTVSSKRSNSSKEGSGGKRKRTENIDEDLLLSRVTNNEIEKYTIPDLKLILQYKNASEALTGLNKKKLVDLVYKYCNK